MKSWSKLVWLGCTISTAQNLFVSLGRTSSWEPGLIKEDCGLTLTTHRLGSLGEKGGINEAWAIWPDFTADTDH